jgi:hypothetical protein
MGKYLDSTAMILSLTAVASSPQVRAEAGELNR